VLKVYTFILASQLPSMIYLKQRAVNVIKDEDAFLRLTAVNAIMTFAFLSSSYICSRIEQV